MIDIKCHWNNTIENPFVQRVLKDAGLVAPVDITLGEGNSTDEMCLEIFGISVDAPPPRRVPHADRRPDADRGDPVDDAPVALVGAELDVRVFAALDQARAQLRISREVTKVAVRIALTVVE